MYSRRDEQRIRGSRTAVYGLGLFIAMLIPMFFDFGDMDIIFVGMRVVGAAVCSFGCFEVAAAKGVNPFVYALIGFIVPPIGAFVVCMENGRPNRPRR